jgi:hypothetical protein
MVASFHEFRTLQVMKNNQILAETWLLEKEKEKEGPQHFSLTEGQ